MNHPHAATNIRAIFKGWLIFCVTFICALCPASFGNDAPKLPPLSEVKFIIFDTGSGWLLDIFPNGSAKITMGPAFGHQAIVPKGTFSFAGVYSAIEQHRVPPFSGGYDRDGITLTLICKGSRSEIFLGIKDKQFIDELFAVLRAKVVPFPGQRLADLEKVLKNPLSGKSSSTAVNFRSSLIQTP